MQSKLVKISSFFLDFKMADIVFHDESLAKLCIICGEAFNDDIYHQAETYLKELQITFCMKFQLIPGVTPTNLCHTCYRTVTSVCSGASLNTAKVPVVWVKHSQNCKTCSYFAKPKVRGRKKKVNNM